MGNPAALTFRFTLSATGSFCAVALMMHIPAIRQIELLAMLALPLRRTLHRQTQEFELPLLQAPRPRSKKISAATEENGTRLVKFQQRYQMRNRILSNAVPALEFCSF